jgi:transcriptional regulator with XRE-family HTH domain
MRRKGRPPANPRIKQLPRKLQQIRTALGLTQQQMLERLGDTQTRVYRGHIGDYETGHRQPPILVLLQYARVAGVPIEILVDDELDLPGYVPGMPEYERLMKRVRISKSR